MKSPLFVIGGLALDITATTAKTTATSILHTSTPGSVRQSLGGVGRNVAEAAFRTGGNVHLISTVGDDLSGEAVLQGMRSIGMNTEYIQTIKGQPTAVYNALHSNDGQLVAAVADMNIFEQMNDSKILTLLEKEKPSLICFDGNITGDSMKSITQKCSELSIPAFFEPTSVPKSLRLFDHAETLLSQSIKFTSPNQYELEAMCHTIRSHPILSTAKMNKTTDHMLKKAPQLAYDTLPESLFLSNFIPNIITKLGQDGCLYVGKHSKHREAVIEYFPPEFIEAKEIKSVTGAGDCFVGTLIANLQKHSVGLSHNTLRQVIHKAQQASIRTLKSEKAVSLDISNDLLV
ncbi:Ribokinase-like protein [Backusella circina FSU 941]|nr:Ribokinase-like protein [Backusella circina FSU 941]